MKQDWRQDRVGAAERGENPMVLTRMRSGFAVIGDTQFIPGYCLLLAAPEANHLTDLSLKERSIYLEDMSIIGEAVMQACQPLRMNYEILGNSLTILHAHIWPRYSWEEEAYRIGPVWRYPKEQLFGEVSVYNEDVHGDLRRRITEALIELMRKYDVVPS